MRTPAPAVRLSALALAGAAGVALAGDVTLELRRADGSLLSSRAYAEGRSIWINAGEGLARVNVYADAETDVGMVYIFGDAGETLEVALSPEAYTPEDDKPQRWANDFGGFMVADQRQRARTAFRGGVSGDVLGPIIAGRVSRFEADGVLRAPITLQQPSRAGVTIFEFGGATPEGVIKLAQGDLTRLISKGDFLGTLVVENGDVLHRLDFNENGAEADFDGTIVVGGTIPRLVGSGDIGGRIVAERIERIDIAGTLGNAEAPAEIRIGAGGIDKLLAGGLFGELIVTGPARDLIFGRVSSLAQSQGDVFGTVDLGRLPVGTGRLGVGGDLDADVRVRSDVGVFKTRNLAPIHVNGVLAEGRTVRIDGRVVGDNTGVPGVLLRAAGGLHGQVIVDAMWDATQESMSPAIADDVRVTLLDGREADLSPLPTYSTPSLELGGGAIGAVPFGVHQGDVATTPATTSFEIPFYGPVRLAPGAGSDALLVERRPTDGGAWTTIATSDYDVIDARHAEPSGDDAPAARRLRVLHDFACGFEYRITTVADLVWSAIDGREGVPTADAQQVLVQGPECPDEPDEPGDTGDTGDGSDDGSGDGSGDDNNTGPVDFFRIFNEISRWTADPRDLNGDGFADIFDLIHLLDELTGEAG
ncbi:MAG: hypothetical protein AAF356_08960 [Planctomycetota bacterium]